MKHTPGPWKYETGQVLAGTEERQDIITDSDGYVLADVHMRHEDGHLIAAAPDMLEALKTTQDMAKMAVLATDPRFTMSPNRAVDFFNRIFPEVAKAIAKAEGEENE